MSLSVGQRLGSYEIVAPIGAGGMGEVYRARDTRLDRDIALKVLPAGAFSDEAARKRFRHEARLLSRLSHPHLAVLHDFDSADGIDFLVMELVSGPPLEKLLQGGALPEREVVRLGAQMVRGLAAAHEKGVIHRDLKPANLRLTPDGLVKVLDFGLAQLQPVMDRSMTTATATAAIAGTPAYMSPEQLLGQRVDGRTDVYGAGVVLYQMATGKKPFEQRSGPQLVAAILNSLPVAPCTVNPALSPALEAVILKAMDKDPALRYQGAGELLVDLERLAAGQPASDATRSSPGAVPTSGHRRRTLLSVVTAIGLVAVAAAAWRLLHHDPGVGATRSLVRVSSPVVGLEVSDSDVYYLEGAYSGRRLMTVPLAGGHPRELPLPWPSAERLQLFGIRQRPPALLLSRGDELWELQLPGGGVSRLEGITGVAAAAWSPAADRLAWVETGETADTIWVGDGHGGDRARLVVAPRPQGGPSDLVLVGWHPSGRFLRYYLEGRALDIPAQGGHPQLVLAAEELPPGLLDSLSSLPIWSPRGDFFLVATTSGLLGLPERPWSWLPRGGIRSLSGPTHLSAIRFTRDGRQLVGCVERQRTAVVRLDPATRAVTPLLDGAPASAATFSPDGARVAWLTSDDGQGRLMVARPDGEDAIAIGNEPGLPFLPPQWSPDAKWIAYTGMDFRLRLAKPEEGTVELLTQGDRAARQADACWSPDGQSLAYGIFVPQGFRSDDAVYLRRVDLATRTSTRLAGSEGLWSPRCTRDGRMLAFDAFAQRAHERGREPGEPSRVFLKQWSPGRGAWSAFSVEVPDGAALNFPTWSRDGRSVYALLSRPRSVVRFDLDSLRLETVFAVQGLGELSPWMGLDPSDAPLVHRDESMFEIVAMDWDEG